MKSKKLTPGSEDKRWGGRAGRENQREGWGEKKSSGIKKVREREREGRERQR